MLKSVSYGIAGIALLLVTCCFIFNIHVNLTPSMPVGFYREMPGFPIKRGDIVEACLPVPLERFGLSRGYLTRGNCPGGSAPVLKKVIGIPGDIVVQYRDRVCIHGQYYIAPVKSVDHLGRVLRHIPLGVPIALNQGYWLYGAGDPEDSWDSRYFGSVTQARLHRAVQYYT